MGNVHSFKIAMMLAFMLVSVTIAAFSTHDQQSLDARTSLSSKSNEQQLLLVEEEAVPKLTHLVSPNKRSVHKKKALANRIVTESINHIDAQNFQVSSTGLDFLYNVFTAEQGRGAYFCDAVLTDVLVDYALERDQRYFLVQDVYLALTALLKAIPPDADSNFSLLQKMLDEPSE